MSADSERLTPTYTEDGLIDMPALAGHDDGKVQIRESSRDDTAAVWVVASSDDDGYSVELTLDKAAGLRDQLEVLIRHHRMNTPVVEVVEAPAPTWRPVRVDAVGTLLAIVDEHGERMTRQADPCPVCGTGELFAGPTRALCANCGRTS